jgi:hypothetical protein
VTGVELSGTAAAAAAAARSLCFPAVTAVRAHRRFDLFRRIRELA